MVKYFENEKSEPAFGMLSFARVNGGDPNLFGSSVKHDQKIQMTLRTGRVCRELNRDWYGAGRKICEVEMSYTQFAECISSMNVGSGVPVTIRYTEKDGNIPPLEIESKRQQYIEEYKELNDENAREINEMISDLEQIFSEKRNLRAKERDGVLQKLRRLSMAVNSHGKYMLDQYDEAMEKITLEAKGEVEAFVENKMNAIALAAIAENRKQITENVPPVEIAG